jgi:hypothetical protein
MEPIEDIHHDLKLIKDWFNDLHDMQKDYVGGQVIYLLPSLLSMTQMDSKKLFLEMIDETLKYGPYMKSYLLLNYLYTAVAVHLSDYPRNEDDFFDWYNQRKNIYESMPKYMKDGLEKDNPNAKSAMEAHCNSLLETLRSWEGYKLKFIVVNQGADS